MTTVAQAKPKDAGQSLMAALEREAKLAVEKEDWDTALKKLQIVLSLNPADAEAQTLLERAREQEELASLYSRGLAHYKAGRLDEALGYFYLIEYLQENYRDVDNLIAEIQDHETPLAVASMPLVEALDNLNNKVDQAAPKLALVMGSAAGMLGFGLIVRQFIRRKKPEHCNKQDCCRTS